MARTTTFSGLLAEVRQRADIEGDPHITDSEIYRMINQSGAALHALMVDMNEAYFMRQMVVPTVAGVETISLTGAEGNGDVYKLLHVSADINGWVRSLSRWTPEKRTLYANATTWGYRTLPVSYRFSRAQDGTVLLYLAPKPDGVYNITIDYVRSFADMLNPGDLYDGADGWEEWVVLDATIKCLVKEESSIVDASRERAEVYARIVSQMQTPDLDHPSVVRDTAGALWWQDGGDW